MAKLLDDFSDFQFQEYLRYMVKSRDARLRDAVENERYEEAALIRDEVKQFIQE